MKVAALPLETLAERKERKYASTSPLERELMYAYREYLWRGIDDYLAGRRPSPPSVVFAAKALGLVW